MFLTPGSLKRLTDYMAGQLKSAVSITGGAINGATVGASAPSTGVFTSLSATSLTSSGVNAASLANGLTAAGTDRATALVLSKEINRIATAAASTGVALPAGVVGQRIVVYNDGTQAIKVYGNGSDTIDGTAGATGVTLTNAKRCEYRCVAANTIISAQLGAVSA